MLAKTFRIRPVSCIVLLSLLHCFAWFVYYGNTPLGESPALDNRQTLLLAQQMVEGGLPAESFHRAPLYPWLLSLFLSAGLPFDLLPLIARLLNAAALATCAGCSAAASRRLWAFPAAPWIAGLLVGLNPVLIFFAGDAFDILLATAALALALNALLGWLPNPSLKGSISIAVILALGAALRSHLLPLALLWPALAGMLAARHRAAHVLGAVLPVALGFFALGCVNLQVSGEFRILPWQGAYNLWAGNKPDASGRIYTQVMRVDFGSEYDNPAKLESIALYEAETGKVPPHSVAEMNAHWTGKALDHITAHPFEWTALMVRKAYYFLNSYEQYDNKTYGFHKRLHAQLRYNPIHWGLLLLLAVAATLVGLRRPHLRAPLLVLTGIFAIYAAGTILFYTPNRFRVPMVPLLAILAAGTPLLFAAWREAKSAWKTALLLCTVLTAGIAYSNFFNARDPATWEEDYALLANASLRSGRNDEAIDWAQRALAMTPSRSDMASLVVQARFNDWAMATPPRAISVAEARERLAQAETEARGNTDLLPIVAIYHWKLGERREALAIWNDAARSDPFARLCLFCVGALPAPEPAEMSLYEGHKHFNLLHQATRESGDHALRRTLDTLLLPATKENP